MHQRSRLRVLSVTILVTSVLALLGACGSETGSNFSDVDGGSTSGDGAVNTSTSGFLGTSSGGDGQAPPDPGNDPDAACVGDACTIIPSSVCGDKKIDGSEQCDDANAVPGDGCSGTCQIEPGYICPTAGQACLYTVSVLCGNNKIEGNEACDDGNTNDGDGCSKGCDVEPGWACTVPGSPCIPVVQPACGDGHVDFGEECDDNNKLANDGCAPDCKLELGFTCPTPGSPCTKLEYCGDGILQTTKGEECDDKNTTPGDGCSGVCKLDLGYACPAQGQPCVKIFVCGNGKVDQGEACDDSNTAGGDGCSSDCSLVEAGYTCPNNGGTGGPCVKSAANVCGDANIAGTEQCDDGNKNKGDGCSDLCAVEAGYTCPTVGKACTKIAFCGDGKVDLVLGEECDDKNKTPGDGCGTQCKLEPNFVCPTPGQPCVSTVKCGDGKVTGAETCDDGATVSGDGCSSTCAVEAGWQCPAAGAKCIAKTCGDGIQAGSEQCDDGDNTAATPGCDATCKLVTGYACTRAVNTKTVCHATTCGDNNPEGFEQCDDGNRAPYDGCSPSCTVEPKCAGGTCTAVCGDGFKYEQEECDDGNTIDGDGCDHLCKKEAGFNCIDQVQPAPASLTIPILYRDVRYYNTTNGHPDFNIPGAVGIEKDLVASSLDTSTPYGKPVFARKGATLSTPENYCWWYHDTDCAGAGTTNPYAKPVFLDTGGNPEVLTLNQVGGIYQFSSSQFVPLSNLGWNATPATTQVDNGCAGDPQGPWNYNFTSEIHYVFTYQGGEKFDFTGDDDVWIFINDKLAVDLGGMHTEKNGSITLSDIPNNRTVDGTSDTVSMASLGLTVGKIYVISMFQAERHVCGSNYKLSLSGFVKTLTQCTAICGDGMVVGDEICDDKKNDGSYGSCLPGCKGRGPFCGDKTKQAPPETCDDGVNQSTYGGAQQLCGPGCKLAPYCGDGVVSNGEACDDGTAANTGGYGKCSSLCVLGPRCGDNIKDAVEQCDHGVNNGGSADTCNANCTLKCGDGVKQAGEQCDDGAAANTGGYGKCNPTCTLGPRCGDGLPNGTEQCDDGKNDGTYGTCKSDCTLANYCGDGTLTNPPELCDLGIANSSTAYGLDKCSNRCTPAPRCGDKAVDGAFGEVCDDGKNDGSAGSCTTDCKGFVPLVSCGNGTIDAPEQCDTGVNNGTAASVCDSHCRFKCGNGIKDTGETCDNGVNDGSYGGCTTNCQIAGYCGDGIKNGNEQCDNAGANQPVSSAYGAGICTTACTFAPYCGDGRVQSSQGEECDSTTSCSAACKYTGPK